ncbi:type IX secretion system outer membrane channel protein PorV [Catalinimonas sp. 4WD22]|uniref:type IX secretion system outer membrane channel protein PorV n=1 Tax=Catalinimonas locisalis TaxID=3133978 RepID=UPI0031012624
MMSKPNHFLPISLFLVVLANVSFSQSSVIIGQGGERLPITSAPFLMITPDARSAGLGEAGVALSTDANAAYWNPARLTLLPEKSNVSFSYTPWLRKVVSNMDLYHFAAAQRMSEKGVWGLSLTYFDLGGIQLAAPSGALAFLDNPHDLSISLSYAHQLNKQWNLGGSAKYIGNNYSGLPSTRGAPQSASGFAVDLGALYQTDFKILQKESQLAVGANIANLGPKMSYFDREEFLPANINIGASLRSQIYNHHSLSWSFNLRKLMVPTPDSVYIPGADKNWFSGTFGSFADAPGGFAEELREIMIGTGLEYGFKETVWLRGGYYHEAEDKGDRRYFTTGLGVRYQILSLDLAYLLPFGTQPGRTHPLQNTLRLGLQIRFGEIV